MQAERRNAACATCHHRKVKCDIARGTPCSNCRKAKRSDCRVHIKRSRLRSRSKTASAHLAAAPEHRLQSLPEPATHRVGHAVPNAGQQFGTLTGQTQGVAVLPGVNGEETKRLLVEFVEQPAIDDRPIDQNARVTFIGTDVSNLNFLTRQRTAQLNAKVCHHPSNRIAKQHTIHEPGRLPADALQLPEKVMVDWLLAAYFERVHPGFPVVDQTRFMDLYEARDPSNPPSLLLLQAMLVLGAHVSYVSVERQAAKAIFFRRAKALFESRFERNRDVVVQAALLLSWHSDGAEDVAANSWYWTHTAATIALGLGLHRDAEPSTLVAHNKRMWRRVFWLTFVADVSLALQYGRPQAVHLADCDVQALKMDDFQDCGNHVQADFVMQLADLSIIMSETISKRFGPKAGVNERAQALIDADKRLAQWTLQLPEKLRLRPTLTLDLHATILHLIYNTFLILLHRPRPPTSLVQDEVKREDADICSAAASHIQSLTEALRVRGEIKLLPSSSVHALFTAMIQLSVESRMANPVLATSAQRRYDSTLASLQELGKVWPDAESISYYFERRASRAHLEVSHTQGGAQTALPSASGEIGELQAEGLQNPTLDRPGAAPNHDYMRTENNDVHLGNTDWQQLFTEGTADRQDYVAFPDWDDWRSDYWGGNDYDFLSKGYPFAT